MPSARFEAIWGAMPGLKEIRFGNRTKVKNRAPVRTATILFDSTPAAVAARSRAGQAANFHIRFMQGSQYDEPVVSDERCYAFERGNCKCVAGCCR